MKDRATQKEEVKEVQVQAMRIQPYGWLTERPYCFSLQALVDESMPELAEFRFKEKPVSIPKFDHEVQGTMYHAEMNGYVWYLFHDPENESGFGGRIFHMPIVDDTGKFIEVRSVKGPWSSRAGVMNCHFEPKCVDAAVTHDPEVWDYTHGCMTATALSLEVIVDAVARGLLPEGFHLEHQVELGKPDRDGERSPLVLPDTDAAMKVIRAYEDQDMVGDYTITVVPDNPKNPPRQYWYKEYHSAYERAVWEAWDRRKQKARQEASREARLMKAAAADPVNGRNYTIADILRFRDVAENN